jgi:hypothetical protein
MSDQMRQSRVSLASAKVERATASRSPIPYNFEVRPETRFNVVQALSIRHLRKRHDAKLFAATKTANPNIAAISRDDPVKTCPRHEIHDLREQRPS